MHSGIDSADSPAHAVFSGGFRFFGLRFLALAVLVLFAACSQAQQAPAQPTWQGVLRNSGGAPISRATIRLAGDAGKASVVTGDDGHFQLAAPQPGQYRLTVEASGRNVEYALPIDLAAAAPAVALTLSDRGELSIAALPQTTATGGEQLSSQAVSELPLNKRDFSQLLLLAAGTMTDANGATNFTQQFAINGQRGVEATFAMDGADISDPEMGGSTFSNFNVDAVEGIQSSSGWMPAEIGRGAAGFTNILTRSGASGFHGSFFEFVRNSAFDARNYFDYATPAYPGRIPPFRRNEFGFTNGGPVYHSAYLRRPQAHLLLHPVPGLSPGAWHHPGDARAHRRRARRDSTLPRMPVTRSTFPSIRALPPCWRVIRCPTIPRGSYGITPTATASKVTTNADQFSLRLDHKLTAKDQFFARFNIDNLTGPTTNPDQTAIDPSFGITYIDRQRNVVGTWTRTASPRLTFESSISITRSTPGFPTTNRTDPAVKFNDGAFEAFNSAAGSVMQAYGNLFQGRQNVTYTARPAAFKAGVEVRAQSRHNLLRHQPQRRIRLWRRNGLRHRTHSFAERACMTLIPATRCLIRFQAFCPAAPSSTPWPLRRLTSPTARTLARPPSAATT